MAKSISILTGEEIEVADEQSATESEHAKNMAKAIIDARDEIRKEIQADREYINAERQAIYAVRDDMASILSSVKEQTETLNLVIADMMSRHEQHKAERMAEKAEEVAEKEAEKNESEEESRKLSDIRFAISNLSNAMSEMEKRITSKKQDAVSAPVNVVRPMPAFEFKPIRNGEGSIVSVTATPIEARH